MDVDHCRSCGRAFSAGEVAGLGILRTRHAAEGGPVMEFACPGCRRVMRLIPYGNARYAHPGEPPPPAPTGSDRLPPWLREKGKEGSPTADPANSKATVPPKPPEHPEPHAPEEPSRPMPPRRGPGDGDRAAAANRSRTGAGVEVPMDPARACAILGIGPTADLKAIEQAYRARALQCHPDKVAHLDEDFRALAERKFKEVQEAYRLLVGG